MSNGADPTANVLALVAAAMKRQDDLRNQAERHNRVVLRLQDKLAVSEVRRIDAVLLVQKADVAVAIINAATTATTLALEVKATRETLEKRLSVIEQNQYSGAGGVAQKAESRQENQWIIGVVIGLIVAVGEFLFLRK